MNKSVHFLGVDLLRFCAAWLVVLDHFSSFGWERATATANGSALAFPLLKPMEDVGSVGVEIFFLISGFVISISARESTPSSFVLSRLIRVVPALWLSGLIALIARASRGEPLAGLFAAYIRSATLSPIGPYIDGVVWTLVVEAVFYAIIFFLLLKSSIHRLETLAQVLGMLSAAFLSIMIGASILSGYSPCVAKLAALCTRFPCKVFLLRHGVFFAVGMLLSTGLYSGFNRHKLRWIGVLSMFCTAELFLQRTGLPELAATVALWWASFIFVTRVAFQHQSSTWITDRRKQVQSLGRVSYPLYLNHYELGMTLTPWLFTLGLNGPEAFLAAAFTVGAVSYLIMRFPERWVQNVLRHTVARRRAPNLTGPKIA